MAFIGDADFRWTSNRAGNLIMLHFKFQRMGVILLGGMLCMLSQSCGAGGSGETLYDVSGTVTYAGKPVPYGSILFVADAEEGNTGPQGVAKIEDGKFDTANAGRGVVGGAYTVIIKGRSTQGSQEDDEGGLNSPLFSDFKTKASFPKENSVQKFDVPEKSSRSVRPAVMNE